MTKILKPEDKSRLLTAIEKMEADGVSESDIQSVVADFKNKYGVDQATKNTQKIESEKSAFEGLFPRTSNAGKKPEKLGIKGNVGNIVSDVFSGPLDALSM